MKQSLFTSLFLLITLLTVAQAASYMDAAQAYNRLMIERNSNAITRVGAFKVVGTPYLFGEHQTANVYAKGETGLQEIIAYNTFNQQLEIQPAGQQTVLKKEAASIDSFRLLKSASANYQEDLLFVNAAQTGSTEKIFLQVMAKGGRFTLYKAYKSTLEIVSANYVQADLRQFELGYEYYYTDTKVSGLKRLKKNKEAIRKEFKSVKDLSDLSVLENFAQNPDEVLKSVFSVINN